MSLCNQHGSPFLNIHACIDLKVVVLYMYVLAFFPGVGLDTHCVLAGIANSTPPKPSEDCSLLTDEETSSSATYTPPPQEQKTRMESSRSPNQLRSAQLPPIPEESHESDQESPCSEPQEVPSPTPAMFVKVPTANHHHSHTQPSDLSILDVTTSELASAYETSKVTTTSSAKKSCPPVSDDRHPPDSRKRALDQPLSPSVSPIGEVHSRLEAQHRQQPQTSRTAVSGTSKFGKYAKQGFI